MALNTLHDLKETWQDENLAMHHQEFFSPEKLAAYLYLTCRAVNYLHKNNIYYGDVKAANILVFRNQ